MNSNIENEGLRKLKEALKEINKWEYENLHLDALEEVIPSIRYQKRMERLIRRQKQPYWRYVNTIGKRVAVFAVAIALAVALSLSVSAVREPVVKFFINVYEKFVEFFYDENDIARAPDAIETVYTLGYVPEGYELERCEIGDLVTRFVWTNQNGERISFSQGVLGLWNQMDNDNSNYEILYVDKMYIACLVKENNEYFYWQEDNYRFTLHIPRDLPFECVRKIIESIMTYEVNI